MPHAKYNRNFHSQVDLIEQILNEFGVTKEIVLEPLELSECKRNSFSLTNRITVKELFRKYGKDLQSAQAEYRSKVEKATEFLINNYKMCKVMDKELGTLSEEEVQESEVEVIDGKIRYNCPMHKCNAKSFRIRKHLKRHSLTGEKLEHAVTYSKLFAENSNKKTSPIKKETKHSNTYLVSKKCNYKVCPLCHSMYRNMTDHLKNFHKMDKSHPDYESNIKNCEVVPMVLTKMKAGKAVKLEGEELEEAKKTFGSDLAKQQRTLTELKNLRSQLEDVLAAPETSENSSKKTEELYKKYKEERYKSNRELSGKVISWNIKFEEYLKLRGDSNPKRGANMAMDVLLAGTLDPKQSYTIENLLNVKELRSILEKFKKLKSTNATSKIKYLTYFEQLVKFLTCDISSPEFIESASNEELIARDIKVKNVNHEIKSVITLLSKSRGADLIKAKERARKKLISADDTIDVLKETQDYLGNLVEQDENEWQSFDMTEIRKIRDSLIMIATIRISRRSKEMTSMTLREVENAEDCVADGVLYKIIKVTDQKQSKSGEPAPIAYTVKEFEALNRYIKHLRPKIGQTNVDNVFLSCCPQRCGATPLNYSAIYKILQKYTTNSGKKLSSRALRGSRVTNSRKKNLSDQDKRDLANAMSHSLTTAERSYNYTNITDSVRKVLTLNRSLNLIQESQTETEGGSQTETEGSKSMYRR